MTIAGIEAGRETSVAIPDAMIVTTTGDDDRDDSSRCRYRRRARISGPWHGPGRWPA